MVKKIFRLFLTGTTVLLASCIDDTYDLANKELVTDVKIEGNKLALPFGSFCPMVLDSMLDLESIPMLEADSVSRTYSLSLNDSLVTRVAQKDLDVLKEVANLSSDIDPIRIELERIKFDIPAFSHSDSLEFGDVELSDVSLDAIHEEVTLSLDELTLDPISIKGEDHTVDFEIPDVEFADIRIEEISQTASFNIDDIEIENVKSDAIDSEFVIDVEQIDMSKVTTPTFTSNMSAMVQNDAIKSYLNAVENNSLYFDIPSIPINEKIPAEGEVAIQFHYTLPKEIQKLDKLELHEGEGDKGSLLEFKVENPSLLKGLKRSIDFNISFPENYELALCDEEYYTLTGKNEISISGMPAQGETTTIRFYLREIKDLDGEKYYEESEGDGVVLKLDDVVSYDVTYSVSGLFEIPKGITVEELKQGLTYSMGLNAAFDVAEVYGATNAVKSGFKGQELDFSFSLKDLEYIKSINKVVLDPSVSKLNFAMACDKDFGQFDIDYPNSKIILSFPEEFVFADDVKLPTGVVRSKTAANDFEISSVSVLTSNEEWVLPVREVKIGRDVQDGNLDFSTKAVVKAVSGTEEDVLTIKGVEKLALKKSVEVLCQDRNIKLHTAPIELAVKDVQGRTNAIDIAFANRTFDFAFDVKGDLEYVKKVGFVEFDTNKPIKISSSAKGFGDIELEEGSLIALRFPEEFVFDTEKSTLPYDKKLKAFVINELAQIKEGNWTLALQRLNINKEIVDNVLTLKSTVNLEAVNAAGEEEVLYVAGDDNFSLEKMRNQGLFGTQDITFVIEESAIAVTEMEVNTNEIEVDFDNQEVTQSIKLESLSYVTHIGNIELKEGSNKLLFRTGLSGGEGLGRFKLATNSVIDFVFPAEFKLDPAKSSIPSGAKFIDSTHIQIYDLKAFEKIFDWELSVKRIAIDQEVIDEKFEKEFTISVVASNADGEGNGKLSIAALDGLTLSEIQKVCGKREMAVSVLPCNIEIADVQASIDDIEFEFENQTFSFPVNVKDLELVKEIKYISFEEGYNNINLKISINSGLEPFDLADNSVVKISLPKEFVLDLKACKFGNLVYDAKENAIYINKVKDIVNCELTLALDRIEINKLIENNQFDWTGEISVAALNKATGEENKLYIAGIDDLLLSEVQDVMGDKVITFDVPSADLRIKEAVLISNMVKADIEESIDIPLDETISEPIDRVDSIGFANPVPMTLTLSTKGLESIDVPVNVNADIILPPVFAISSQDDKVTVTDKGLHIETAHVFKESSGIQLELWVNSLDFTSLEGGCLILSPTENGGRQLKYNGQASIVGSVSVDNAQLSSNILNTGVSFDVSFEMGEIVLSDFTGIYGGTIEKVVDTFELGIEDGFAELEKNGLTLTNTKPELMVSLYNTIGVPVDVDLSIVGRDKEGNAIATSTIAVNDLRIRPAYVDKQGTLIADTTRWIFTSNEAAQIPGYEVVVVKNLDSLLNELPYSIDFMLDPQIITKDVVHRVDLSKPLELGGRYSISVPFDLEFAQSIDLDLGEVTDIVNNKANKVTLANPQLALAIHNPIAQDLVFDLSLIGKDANGQPINTASIVFDEPFVLAAGQRNADGTITPKATRWLFAVNDSITKKGYETKVALALGTLLNELPRKIDVALNAHFNTDLTTQIDYNNDLELMCEYGVMVPLEFDDIHLNYADTVPEIKFNLEETLMELNLSVNNIGLAVGMDLKNTLPLGLKLNLIPLDERGNIIEDIEIGSIEIPAGDGSDIGNGESVAGTPVELSVKCANSAVLSTLDKIAFSLDVASGNGDNVLSGKQGLHISDIVLQIMCDIELGAGK